MNLREMALLVVMVVQEVRRDLTIDQETVHHVISTTTDADAIHLTTMEMKSVISKEVHQKPKMNMDVDEVMIVVVMDEVTEEVMAMIDMDMVKTTKVTEVMVKTIVVNSQDIKLIKMEEIQDHEIHVTIQEVHKVQTQEDWTHAQAQDQTLVLTRDLTQDHWTQEGHHRIVLRHQDTTTTVDLHQAYQMIVKKNMIL